MLAPSEYDPDAVRGYLDTATYALPPRSVVAAVERALAEWRERHDWLRWEEDAERCRALFASIVGAEAEDIGVTTAVSVSAGLVAASLPAGAGDNIVVHEGEFASNLFPWVELERRGVEVRALPLEELGEAIDERTALVAVSSVQSADGAAADVARLTRRGARVFVDATHSVGALPTNLEGIDYLACSAYKWIPAPRGLSFLYVRRERLHGIQPWLAGWKARADWRGRYYGLPRDLSADASRLDTSLAWLVVSGAVPALELIVDVGVERIARHDLALARRFASELGLPEPAAPIVRVTVGDADAAVERLRARGVTCAVRAGAVRASFHLYNDEADVDLALDALVPTLAGARG
ncbi:MAG: aminotransferase class V-fold PLP-dependent enzyme [Actinomycetota bacterium]|nr:aminotransferase class V-fold PLP-dependent enzyme [Actinomycetota bacterium]